MATNTKDIRVSCCGADIFIWCSYNMKMKYVFYTKREAVKRFKEHFSLRGKAITVDFIPYWAF